MQVILTRRLVDVSQDVIINEDDCGTLRGLEITPLKKTILSLKNYQIVLKGV